VTQLNYPFTFTPNTTADADQMMANLNANRAVVNGSLEGGTNVRTGIAGAVSATSGEGGSLLMARSDHTHAVQGLERFTTDPTSANFVGREYFNTTTNQTRLCIALGSPDTWVSSGNPTAADLPAHASRHATGGPDALPANSVAQSMFAARTIYEGVPSADVSPSANAWTDIITGLAVTVTATQLAWFIVNVAYHNTHATNVPQVAFRIEDGASAVLWQSPLKQISPNGGNSEFNDCTAIFPIVLAASPTLKLRANTSAAGLEVKKSQTVNASTFAVTRLQVVVG
jgi:hypothetical protein